MRTQRKLLALLIAIILAMSVFPITALADGETNGECGAEGNNVTWKVEDDTLIISGSGAMADFTSAPVPWEAYKNSLKSVEIEEGITSVGVYAFKDHTALESVSIPSSVTGIGAWAFAGCSAIKKVSIPNCNIGNYAFEDCTSLQEVNFAPGIQKLGYGTFSGCSALSNVEIPEGVTMLQGETFLNCSSLTSITIPASITEIARGVGRTFEGSGLEKIVIPGTVTSIGSKCFFKCENLSDITIENGVATLGSQCFSQCAALKSVVIPSSVTSIDNTAFQRCNLEHVVLPANLDSIGENAGFDNGCVFYVQTFDDSTAFEENLPQNAKMKAAYAVTNGGTFAANTVFESDKLAPPTTKVGHTFDNWYADDAFETEAGAVTAGQTYYAKWTLKAPTVEVTADKTNVVTGKSVTLTANAEHELADVTYAYQWYQDDAAIEGATEASYITGSLTADAAYSCAVTASKDDETSEAATGSVAIKVSAREGTLTLSAASGEVLTTAGQVSLTYDYNGDGPVTASSSDESVATVAVDQTAKKVTVTVQKAGTAVITVSAGATDTYTAASAVYNLTVKEPAPVTPGGSSHSGSSSTPTYAVTVDSGRHGTVTVSPKSARKGASVTLTVKPDDGYELDDLTVTDASGKAVKVTEGKNGKFTFTMPASKVEVDATFTAIKEETPAQRFTDVPNGYWAEEEINWAAENGYINGNTAATFNPEGTVTRQQLWMILARLSGYQPADFTEARAWAVDNSISDGTNPGGAVSRQQLVSILYRYAVRMGYDASGSADLTAYPDHADLASYATGAMGWSVANGIVGGTAQGTLAPAGTATRAQFAVILYRFCDKVVG